MLGNLMKNAIEASPEGGTVTVSIEGPRDVIMVRLHNAGAVPEAIRDSFFEKYHSVGKTDGTGLGTYSARLMARTQGGDISMRTSAETGTTISIWLRAAPASAMPDRPDSPEAERDRRLATNLGEMRVLVVDDDEFNRLIVRRYLPPPVIVEAAVNGRSAVEAAASSPDVILMDLDMPIMDGHEAVPLIRADEARTGRRRAAIIALSSHDDDQTRARCLATGFDYYLTKPVTRELLHETIARLGGARPAGAAPPPEIADELKPLLPGFIASRREIAAQMHAALGAADREAVRRAAHKLAGSFALYGFAWAAGQSREIERDALAGEGDRLDAMIVALRDHLDLQARELEIADIQSGA
jgi:CheY-like chemotaxis protein